MLPEWKVELMDILCVTNWELHFPEIVPTSDLAGHVHYLTPVRGIFRVRRRGKDYPVWNFYALVFSVTDLPAAVFDEGYLYWYNRLFFDTFEHIEINIRGSRIYRRIRNEGLLDSRYLCVVCMYIHAYVWTMYRAVSTQHFGN